MSVSDILAQMETAGAYIRHYRGPLDDFLTPGALKYLGSQGQWKILGYFIFGSILATVVHVVLGVGFLWAVKSVLMRLAGEKRKKRSGGIGGIEDQRSGWWDEKRGLGLHKDAKAVAQKKGASDDGRVEVVSSERRKKRVERMRLLWRTILIITSIVWTASVLFWMFALPLGILYIGLPPPGLRFLTFGFHIGGLLPSTCEASLPIEGRDGLPCYLKDFKEWTIMWMQSREGYDGSALREMWRGILLQGLQWLIFLWAVAVLNFAVGEWCRRRRERREKRSRRREGMDAGRVELV